MLDYPKHMVAVIVDNNKKSTKTIKKQTTKKIFKTSYEKQSNREYPHVIQKKKYQNLSYHLEDQD